MDILQEQQEVVHKSVNQGCNLIKKKTVQKSRNLPISKDLLYVEFLIIFVFIMSLTFLKSFDKIRVYTYFIVLIVCVFIMYAFTGFFFIHIGSLMNVLGRIFLISRNCRQTQGVLFVRCRKTYVLNKFHLIKFNEEFNIASSLKIGKNYK